ncbi:DDE_3 domain-containing protein [Trichonephila clavipes]|nr:DDE_3 domain-containing protein [Trichonephila clavipes]
MQFGRYWREVLGDPLPPFMLFCYLHGNRVSQKDNCTSHRSQVATGWLDKHSSDFFVTNWPPRNSDLNPIEHMWDVLEQGVKDHHTQSQRTLLNYGQI